MLETLAMFSTVQPQLQPHLPYAKCASRRATRAASTKLNVARGVGLGDLPEVSVANLIIWVHELCMVPCVEELCPELQFQ
jgi:hypothetical protein